MKKRKKKIQEHNISWQTKYIRGKPNKTAEKISLMSLNWSVFMQVITKCYHHENQERREKKKKKQYPTICWKCKAIVSTLYLEPAMSSFLLPMKLFLSDSRKSGKFESGMGHKSAPRSSKSPIGSFCRKHKCKLSEK